MAMSDKDGFKPAITKSNYCSDTGYYLPDVDDIEVRGEPISWEAADENYRNRIDAPDSSNQSGYGSKKRSGADSGPGQQGS